MTPSPPSQADALILDLFGVIVAFDDELVYQRIAQRCADPVAATEYMANLVSAPSLICGHISLNQIHAQLVESLSLDASLDEFEGLWMSSYSEPMPGMRDLLHQLTHECKLVLLSNVDRYYWRTVESSIPELQGFHAKVLSFQEGVAKPNALAFKRAVAASGTTVERCYFVDDKPENTDAAAKVGLASHTFQNCRLLKEALRGLGLQVA